MRRPMASNCSNGLPRSKSETFAPAFASVLAASSRKVFVYSSARSQNMVRQKPILSSFTGMAARGFGAKPVTAARNRARSSTARAKSPTVSKDAVFCFTPCVLTSP